MASSEPISDQYSRYRNAVAAFPYKCRMFLSLLLALPDHPSPAQVPKAVRKNYEPFTAAFKRLSAAQRAYLLSRCVSFATARLGGQRAVGGGPNIHEIQTTCETRSSFYGVSYWQRRNFKFEYLGMVVRLSTGKKLELVQLKNYLVRESASQRDALVLEAIENYLPENRQKITIRFGNRSIFQEIYFNLRETVVEAVLRRVDGLLSEEREGDRCSEEAVRGLTFLTQRIINEYIDGKQAMLKKLRTRASLTFTVYSTAAIQVRCSTESRKYYYLDYALPPTIGSISAAKDTINLLSNHNIQNRFYCEPLQSFSQNIWAHYYKITTNTLECESVMLVETVQREDRIQRVMHATETVVGASLPFFSMELVRNEEGRYHFSLMAVIKISPKGTASRSREAVKILLSMVTPDDDFPQRPSAFTKSPPELADTSISNSQPRKKSFSEHKGKENPLTEFQPSIQEGASKLERRDSSDNQDDQEFYSIENEQIIGEMQDALNNLSAKNMGDIPTHDIGPHQAEDPPTASYLKAKPFLVPLPLKDCERRLIDENFLKRDWKKMSKGGVICVNEAVVSEQKKIFKLLCKQFGSKVFKMQGIMSFSLPVQICRPESTLISIARNVSYAPLLLEPYASLTPLQLIKNTIIFQISMAVLSLSTQTPFNPIVGETYQGVINGCPIFMEQLSHHPAVSYLLLIGRGYRVYGAIGPQICIRLNYIKGINSKWLTVEFDNGHRLEFSVPTIIINGMLFGDRNIYFDSTNYVLDQKNGLLAEVVFNAGNKSFFGNKDNPDFLTAEVYQLTPAFLDAFLASKRTLSPKKDDKNKLLASITGQWNGRLHLGEEVLLDFQNDLPLVLEHYSQPLQSDSVYRGDAINLLAGAMERAQEEKEQLEQLQRKDKKLRQEYAKHRHK